MSAKTTGEAATDVKGSTETEASKIESALSGAGTTIKDDFSDVV